MKNILIFFVVGVTQLVVDTILFSLLVKVGVGYVVGNFISRGIAAVTGYFLNGKFTFRKPLSKTVFVKFWLYWCLMTALSSLLLIFSRHIMVNIMSESYVPTSSKVIVEFILFFISYLIAKVWVYKK